MAVWASSSSRTSAWPAKWRRARTAVATPRSSRTAVRGVMGGMLAIERTAADERLFMTREWKDITGAEGRYQVSSDGYVRSLPDIDSRGRFMPGLILRAKTNEKGYQLVNIDRRLRRVHRLVAETFLPNPDGKPEVNHKNGNKADNRRGNLTWATSSENQLHRYQELGHRGPATGKRGALCPNSKKVVGINVRTREVVRFAAASEAGRELGISGSGVSACANGRLRTYRGWEWAYE